MLPRLYFKKDTDFYPSCALNISTKIFLLWAKCLYHCSPDICSAPYLELLKGCIYLGTEQSYKSAWKVLWDVLKTPVIKTASGVFFHQSFWISDFKLFSQSEEIKMLWCWKLNPRLACYHWLQNLLEELNMRKLLMRVCNIDSEPAAPWMRAWPLITGKVRCLKPLSARKKLSAFQSRHIGCWGALQWAQYVLGWAGLK